MMEKSRKKKSEEGGLRKVVRIFLAILYVMLSPSERSSGSAERNNEGMALKIRVERFHLFRFFLHNL